MNVEKILYPYLKEGCSCFILTGRDIYDVEASGPGHITSIVRQMAEYCYIELNMILVRYSLSQGLAVPYWLIPSREERETVKKCLSDAGIAISNCTSGSCNASQELVDILRGIMKLTDEGMSNHKFAFLLEFSSDLLPNANTVNQLTIRELIFQIYRSRNFMDSGNLLMLSDVSDGKLDSQIQAQLPKMVLTYPDCNDKLDFINALHQRYPNQKYETGLVDSHVANITSGTPNCGLENLFRSNQPITASALIKQKTKDIEEISEGTCTMLDASLSQSVRLCGRNIEVPLKYLMRQAQGLLNRDKATATNILLAGAPGTAKTQLCLHMGLEANVPVVKLNSPKQGIVGETERRVALQTRILSSFNPSIGFIDEFTENIPVSRGTNLDAGASDAVLGGYLSLLSDNSREGRNILLGTTNCLWKLGSAFLDRMTVVPVIMPSSEDLPDILCSLIEETTGAKYERSDKFVQEASIMFYQKHIMPRRIRAILKFTNQTCGINPKSILRAAEDANPLDEFSWMGAVYADLNALYYTVTQQLLPWYGHSDYPFPEYIRNILDTNMEIDPVKLHKEIQRLKPYVNV